MSVGISLTEPMFYLPRWVDDDKVEEEEEIVVFAYLSSKSNVCLFVVVVVVHVRTECETVSLCDDLKLTIILSWEHFSIGSVLIEKHVSFTWDLVSDCSHSSDQNHSKRKGPIKVLQKQHKDSLIASSPRSSEVWTSTCIHLGCGIITTAKILIEYFSEWSCIKREIRGLWPRTNIVSGSIEGVYQSTPKQVWSLRTDHDDDYLSHFLPNYGRATQRWVPFILIIGMGCVIRG